MAINMKGKSILTIHELDIEEIHQIFDTSKWLKTAYHAGQRPKILEGRTLGMIFQKASTRTRVSFEVGIAQLGGQGLYLSSSDLQLGRGENIEDTARVLGRYLDGIMARTYSHQDVVDLASYSGVPVINGLTDFSHPCQGLTDYFTVLEKLGRLQGIRFSFVGDGNNMAHSLIYGAAKLGIHITVGAPAGYEPDKKVVKQAKELAKKTGGSVKIENDPVKSVKGAQVVYTDVWASMGQEKEQKKRAKAFASFQINSKLMSHADSEALFMHCLPAHRGEEVTDEVADSPNSIIFDQAENRLHVQKGIMALIMG